MVLQSRSRFSTFQVKNMGVLESWFPHFPLQTRRFSDSMMISIYSLLKQPAGFSFLQDQQLIAVYGTLGGFTEPSRSPTPPDCAYRAPNLHHGCRRLGQGSGFLCLTQIGGKYGKFLTY